MASAQYSNILLQFEWTDNIEIVERYKRIQKSIEITHLSGEIFTKQDFCEALKDFFDAHAAIWPYQLPTLQISLYLLNVERFRYTYIPTYLPTQRCTSINVKYYTHYVMHLYLI